jgi:hypothetical protein
LFKTLLWIPNAKEELLMKPDEVIRKIQEDMEKKAKELDQDVTQAEEAKGKLPEAESGGLLEQKAHGLRGPTGKEAGGRREDATISPGGAPSRATPPDRSSTSP